MINGLTAYGRTITVAHTREHRGIAIIVFELFKRAGNFLSPFDNAPFFETQIEASEWAAAHRLLNPLSVGRFETIEVRKVSRYVDKGGI